jgi:hypothetical protein
MEGCQESLGRGGAPVEAEAKVVVAASRVSKQGETK